MMDESFEQNLSNETNKTLQQKLYLMLHKQELRKQVIQYFRCVGSGENIVQCIKEALFLHENFNPVLLFEVLSKGKQKLTSNDWKNYLLQHNINFGDEDFKYFMKQNQYNSEITLNEFLESVLPYNADVVREYKQKYLESLQIREFDPEVEFIFAELIDNQFKLFRSLISIRQQISSMATLKQVENIVKEDLVMQSKPREGRKFHETFQNRNFQLGFHELRKFLQLWVSGKEILHEFYMLNIVRHLKSDNPFCKLSYKGGKKKGSSKANQPQSGQKRAFSAKTVNPKNTMPAGFGLTNEKLKEKLSVPQQRQLNSSFQNSRSGDKYGDFKKQMMDQYIKTKKQEIFRGQHDKGREDLRSSNRRQELPHQLARSRDLRNSRGIDGHYVIKFLEEMVLKEERLEKLRKTLAKNNDFNLINLFKLLDDKNKGYVSSRDITDYTLVGKVQFNHMVNFYARQPEKLRFHEFCLIFRPLSRKLNEQIDSRPEHKVPNPFKGDTNKLILEVLSLTAQMHSNLQKLRNRMDAENVQPKEMFRYLDVDSKGYLDSQGLETILKENNIFCDDKNMKCLMKLFRKKVDERISINEFLSMISL